MVHFASVQPPPIPIQVEDDSDCPFVCCRALGTVQSPAIEWNFVPRSCVPWL